MRKNQGCHKHVKVVTTLLEVVVILWSLSAACATNLQGCGDLIEAVSSMCHKVVGKVVTSL